MCCIEFIFLHKSILYHDELNHTINQWYKTNMCSVVNIFVYWIFVYSDIKFAEMVWHESTLLYPDTPAIKFVWY